MPCLLVTLWGVSVLILSNAYMGMFLSNHVVTNQRLIINSLNEIPASHIRPLVRRGTALEVIFKVITFP